MEEQRRVQEAEIGRSTGGEGGQQNPSTNTEGSGKINTCTIFCEYDMYNRSIDANILANTNEMDVTRLTEDEQIALAIQMSMSQAESTLLFFLSCLNKSFPWFLDANDVEMKEETPQSAGIPSNTQQPSKVVSFKCFYFFKKSNNFIFLDK